MRTEEGARPPRSSRPWMWARSCLCALTCGFSTPSPPPLPPSSLLPPPSSLPHPPFHCACYLLLLLWQASPQFKARQLAKAAAPKLSPQAMSSDDPERKKVLGGHHIVHICMTLFWRRYCIEPHGGSLRRRRHAHAVDTCKHERSRKQRNNDCFRRSAKLSQRAPKFFSQVPPSKRMPSLASVVSCAATSWMHFLTGEAQCSATQLVQH